MQIACGLFVCHHALGPDFMGRRAFALQECYNDNEQQARPQMSESTNWQGDLERIRRAQTARGRVQAGYFSIEGLRLHERALRAGWVIELALIGTAVFRSSAPRQQTLLADLTAAGTRLVEVPDEVMRAETGGRDLGALLGLLRLPQPPALAELVAGQVPQRPLFLVAADIKEPGNVGALARTAHAGGATAFIAIGASDPYHPKALRTSMGSLLKLPVLRFADTEALLAEVHGLGIHSVGMALSGGVALPRASFSQRGVAVLAGNEAWGLAEEVQTAVDSLVYIPMPPGVDSFSVNAAAAIVLYEIGRAQMLRQSEAALKVEGWVDV
jgi:TrmH family RNA methyltransferase